jgi:hypothetical protein
VDARSSFNCECRVVADKIVFCRLHEAAETLLAACDYLKKIISTVELARPEQENLIREIVLPYAEQVIERASRQTTG